jgi:hypothetical protein
MRDLLDRYLHAFPRGPEDGGTGGGGGNGGAGDGNAGAGAPSDGSGGAPAGGGAGGDGGAPLEQQGGDGGDGGDGGNPSEWKPQWPDGFPEHLRGKDEAETLDKVNKALAGYREKDAKRDIPENPKDYLSLEGLKDFELSDELKPHFEQLSSDPIFEPLATEAKEIGVERPQFLRLWKKGMEAMGEAGLLEPPVDEKAERAALLPDEAKSLPPAEQDKAIDKRMQDNLDFIDLMVENRGLDKEAGEYAQLMLADRAKGHKFMEWIRNQFGGAGPGPGAHGGGGAGDSRESLRAELMKPEMQPGHPAFDPAKWRELDERYKAVVARDQQQKR